MVDMVSSESLNNTKRQGKFSLCLLMWARTSVSSCPWLGLTCWLLGSQRYMALVFWGSSASMWQNDVGPVSLYNHVIQFLILNPMCACVCGRGGGYRFCFSGEFWLIQCFSIYSHFTVLLHLSNSYHSVWWKKNTQMFTSFFLWDQVQKHNYIYIIKLVKSFEIFQMESPKKM
jgi:hypothetical protein